MVADRLTGFSLDQVDAGGGAQPKPVSVDRTLGIDGRHQEKTEPAKYLQDQSVVEAMPGECHQL